MQGNCTLGMADVVVSCYYAYKLGLHSVARLLLISGLKPPCCQITTLLKNALGSSGQEVRIAGWEGAY